MNFEELVEFLSVNEPDEETIRNYLVVNVDRVYKGHLSEVGYLIAMKQFGKFDSMRKLKLLLIVYNLVPEMRALDQILGLGTVYSAGYYQKNLSAEIIKCYTRVSTSVKYNKFNHKLTIAYESSMKE